jgi:hypothetical protein
MNQPNMIKEVNDVFNTPLTTQENQMEAIITGTSGKQYIAMDTTPPRVDVGTPSVFDDRKDEPSIKELFSMLLDVVGRIGAKVEALESHYHQQSKPQPIEDLATTVDTVLQQADWLYARVCDEVDNRFDIRDLVQEGLTDKIESEVDNYFSHNFSLDDHVDVDDMIKEAVRDSIEDVVREALTNVTMSFNI